MRAAYCRLLLLPSLAACSSVPPFDPALADVPPALQQAVVVRADAPGSPDTQLVAFERDGAAWRAVYGPMPAVVGRSGVCARADKREGDGHTPDGVHAIGTAFGYAEQAATKLAYRQATAKDRWVDAPESEIYNRWVEGDPGVSREVLRRDDHQYELAFVLEWNTNPVVKGRGSAIFAHVWKAPGAPTSGCVAVAREDLARLLAWLDRTQQPVVVVRR